MHVFCWCVELRSFGPASVKGREKGIELFHHLDQEARGARSEPIVIQGSRSHGLQHAERVIDAFGVAREMVAVVTHPEFFQYVLISQAIVVGNALYAFLEVTLQFLLREADKQGKIQVIVKDGTIWCTQKAMAQLFGVDRSVITKHLKNIFESGELKQESVCAKNALTAADGKKYQTTLYNLDAIISVGYRVNSIRATKFRQWATLVLKEYITKGFALDDERLKQGTAVFGKDYFRELLERVRSIRASERRIWQQITDIYAECSTDYDKSSPTTRDFYAMIQNRFHYAITGMTAAEIIYTRADHTKDHMGLTTWKHAPDGRVLKSDVSIAKNYLQPEQIKRLERAVTGFFDYIEDLIERENTFTMDQFSASVNKFLEFRNYHILPDKGKISAAEAKAKAEQEYDIFNKTQKIDSDFDKEIRKLKGE